MSQFGIEVHNPEDGSVFDLARAITFSKRDMSQVGKGTRVNPREGGVAFLTLYDAMNAPVIYSQNSDGSFYLSAPYSPNGVQSPAVFILGRCACTVF
ncbi:hypothetical protein [Wohlfahrtiimonas chitiniclastica]|uniref:hypothetical protein n=1 Tax=Wohlfahrtiimonas chitiniclastica TaxID=400946 RepID=UPI001BD075B0|nr:hypothetical protein [Wohlfahrtiimonas chitiniclastica]MBS7815938.1 hypothetical protein [Wohlfahrtiimonas chitiniclastica]MBS7822067.1 hypothetical protein [Wohlfahrtiimonas chitiniclastica]MBS7829859.1 hypothetical protein [Wohlfahrtiimonas chitiniclastica]MBS7831826.1 hypothetical protein [Wohlfahrtiimonas chitiniclastica]